MNDRLRTPRTAWLAMALALLAAGPGSPLAAQDSGISLPIGTAAPDAALEDLDGNPVSLLEVVDGRPALLEFWATWCPLCEALQPQLDRIQATYGDRLAIVAVGVAVNQNPRRIKRHLERHDPGYPYLYDARGEAVRAYGAVSTSIVVLLDAEGRVAYTGVGANQDLEAAVGALMAGEAPSAGP
jgi:thiol-disulfide isomerase/thioredoxin